MNGARVTHLGGLMACGVLSCAFAASGPHAYDTGELVGAAFVLGGSHPPGQALHSILGFAATLIPLGPPAFRVSLVSVLGALAAAATCGALALRTARFVASRPLPVPVVAALPLASGFALVVSPVVLRQATRPEVYTTAIALFGTACLAFTAWAQGRPTGLRVGAFAAGLGTCMHPPHGLAALGVLAIFAVSCRRDLVVTPRSLGWAGAFFVLGLTPLALLPVRAHAGAPMWGDPTTLSGLWAYVSAHAYRRNLGTAGGSLAEQVLTVARYVPYAAGIVPFFGLLAFARAARRLSRRERGLVTAALFSLGAALVGALVTPIDVRVPDMVAYAGPVVLLAIAFGAAGMALLPRWRFGLLGLLALAASVFAIRDAPSALVAEAPVLDAMAASLTTSPRPRSLVIVTKDFSASTWMMERATADARPDVAFLVSGLASSSWHQRSLASHPAFDGVPRAGPGRDPWERYTRGAMEIAGGRIPLAVETDEWSGGNGVLAGPYLLGDARLDARVLSRSTGERLAPGIAALARSGPAGDHDVVHAIYRDYEVTRARRLLLRGADGDAERALRWALIQPDETERRALSSLRSSHDRAGHLAPVVEGRSAVGVSRPEAVRHAAVLLALKGDVDAAMVLLDQQAADDPRALLQAGWIAFADGRPDVARRTLEELERVAPDLRSEAEALRERLR